MLLLTVVVTFLRLGVGYHGDPGREGGVPKPGAAPARLSGPRGCGGQAPDPPHPLQPPRH
jgi:hypothetical protein